jgi:hypothetical protein
MSDRINTIMARFARWKIAVDSCRRNERDALRRRERSVAAFSET